MKMAFNKDALIKHRFWLILLLVPPIALIALFFLSSSAAESEKKLKELQGNVKEVNAVAGAAANVKTQKMIEAILKQASDLAGTTNEVHEAAYKAQESIYTWPPEMEDLFEFTYVAKPKDRPEPRGLFAEVIRINSDKKGFKTDPSKNIVYGNITDEQKDYFRLEDEKGNKYKIYATHKDKIEIYHGGQEKQKRLPFNNAEMKNFPVSVFYQKGKYFHDSLTDSELLNGYRDNYIKQIYSILDLVQPIDANGQGRVRLGTWTYAPKTNPSPGTFIHYLNKELPEGTDYSEDVWINQENLWIQREIYNIIKEANDSVAKFKLQPEKLNDKTKVPRAYVCTNPYWELTMHVDEKKEDTVLATCKNLLPRGQKFNFDLKITAGKNGEPLLLKAPKGAPPFNPQGYSKKLGTADDGEYIQEIELSATALDGKKAAVDLTKTEILAVEQELNWETAAVRRIDSIYISNTLALSNRQFVETLKAYVPPEAQGGAGAPTAGATAAAPSPGADPKAAPPVAPPGPKIDPKGAAAGGGESETKTGKQSKDRYIASESTRQFRKLPVAVVLTVEQAQVDRIQTAFNNSKLRFLTSQVMLTHTTGSLRPATGGPVVGVAKEPGKEPIRDPIRDPGKFNMPPFNPMDPFPKINPQAGIAAGGNELEANVELVIYGTVTIYERYPPRMPRPNKAEWK